MYEIPCSMIIYIYIYIYIFPPTIFNLSEKLFTYSLMLYIPVRLSHHLNLIEIMIIQRKT
jgi:hypothetical protein